MCYTRVIDLLAQYYYFYINHTNAHTIIFIRLLLLSILAKWLFEKIGKFLSKQSSRKLSLSKLPGMLLIG